MAGADLGHHAALVRSIAASLPQASLAPARQRLKLWELVPTVHCSVIGTCLTTAELRRVMARVAQADVAGFSDHDLHAEAVGMCSVHNACSKLLQKALDARHAAIVRQFARLDGEDAVLARWREERRSGDIPGAYWAVLTHPDCSHEGLRQAFGDVHMLSHLVGAANRADIRRLAVLEAENTRLTEKAARQQERLHAVTTTSETTIRRMSALLAVREAAGPAPAPDEAAAALRDVVAELQSRLSAETARRERAELRLAAAARDARTAAQAAETAIVARDALARELAVLERQEAGPATALPPACILYVGGHPGCVTRIRMALEAAGGSLLCHDGGREDHPSLLAGLIGQAGEVAFPVDCVSHDAALTVKRLCRQLGKRWRPLRSAGLGSFLAAFAGPAGPSTNTNGHEE